MGRWRGPGLASDNRGVPDPWRRRARRRADGLALRLAPPVVAVVVARDPGAWFERPWRRWPTRTTPTFDPRDRRQQPARGEAAGGAAAPGAFVRRLEDDPGFGAAANEVFEVVEGAAFYLFCHDDVALGAGRGTAARGGGLPVERGGGGPQARRLGRPSAAPPGGPGDGPRRLRRAAGGAR